LVVKPSTASAAHPLADGVLALPDGLALLTASRVLLCADAHLGYEEVMGGGAVLPLWSTSQIVAALVRAAERTCAREIVFLGDAIHGTRMSEGAARTIGAALERLRACAPVTVIAGNHEGRSRGAAILGATVECCERDGWTLSHGDRPDPSARRTIIGHLHPALHVGGRGVPAFLAAARLVVVPALTPYSRGLDVRSRACGEALRPWGVTRRELQVVAATSERVLPFGSLAALGGFSAAEPT
jgi:metallophosphoesterase superfamily enzyme